MRERLTSKLATPVGKPFQSTLPCGSDGNFSLAIRISFYFNPRSLAGATQETYNEAVSAYEFQSTLPCGSDLAGNICNKYGDISIHAPLRERPNLTRISLRLLSFQSTLPCGSDNSAFRVIIWSGTFQSTLPCGSDRYVLAYICVFRYFNPRSLAGAT